MLMANGLSCGPMLVAGDNPTGTVIAAADADRDPGTGVITDSAITFGHDTGLHAGRGYDDVTGVGTPTRRYLDSY